MKIIFFGLGSIGQRHAALIRKHWPEYELYAFRTHKGQKAIDKSCYNTCYLYDWASVEDVQPDVAFITNPTFLHINTAIKCAKRGMHLFIEKPIGANIEGLNYLLNLVSEKNLTAYVGYDLRFHPAIKTLYNVVRVTNSVYSACLVCRSYLPGWRPDTDHEKCYSANEEMGGGALLDVSHEFYYAEQLFGPVVELEGTRTRRSNVTVDTDDYVDILMKHESGLTSRVILDLASRNYERYCELYFTDTRYAEPYKININTDKNTTNATFLAQLEHFFGNIGNSNLAGNLAGCISLFRKLIEFREETKV